MTNSTNKIEKLIAQHCSNGVEFEELQNICHLTAGDRIIKTDMNNNYKFPVMGGGNKPTGRYKKSNFPANTITIARAGSAGFVNWLNEPFWATDVCFCANQKMENVLLKFVFYYLKNKQPELEKNVYGGTMMKLNKLFLWKCPIPIPPLAVQEEIVKILDTFTELEAELEARNKQYEYYREKLLTFKGGGGEGKL